MCHYNAVVSAYNGSRQWMENVIQLEWSRLSFELGRNENRAVPHWF